MADRPSPLEHDATHEQLSLVVTNTTGDENSSGTSVTSSTTDSNSDPEPLLSQVPGEDVLPTMVPSYDVYHPPYLFCGECTSCDAPPPPIMIPKRKRKHDRKKKKRNKHVTGCCDDGVCIVPSAESTFTIDDDDDEENNDVDESSSSSSSGGTSQFQVEGICCPSEVPAIRSILTHPEIRKVNVNVTTKIVYVRHEKMIGAPEIVLMLKRGGFSSRIVKDFNCLETQDKISLEAPVLSLNVFFSGFFWILSMCSFFGEEWENLKYFGILSVFFGAPPIARKAILTVSRCQFDANCMMLIAAIGSLALGEYDEAASVSFLFSVSEYLEAKATMRARQAMGDIYNLRPEKATLVKEGGVLEDVTVDKVRVGDTALVKTGDKIPCDGEVTEGTSLLDESSLTGESRPVSKTQGDTVCGGSVNIGDGPLTVRCTAAETDSALARLVRLVEEAQSNRSPTEKIVDMFAKRYTPVVICMSIAMFTLPWLWGEEMGKKWALNGLILIVVACPCALTISTPVTYAAGLAACAKRGIIVKGGAHLEALGRVQKIIFDKTGTLTTGEFDLIHLNTVGEQRSRSEVLELLALMEEPSSHPLSNTLVQAAIAENIAINTLTHTVKNHSVLQGEGISALVNSIPTYVGNKRLFERLGMYKDLPSDIKTEADIWSNDGGTVGFLGLENTGIIAAFCVSDKIRDESRDVVLAIKHQLNIEIFLLSGDSDGAAQNVAKKVGIRSSNVHGHLNPEKKLKAVKRFKEEQPSRSLGCCNYVGCTFFTNQQSLLLMCGDGINDAPALAMSDIGVAMGSGAAMAMEMSDVTLMDSNLTKLFDSLIMGRKVLLTIKENISFSLLIKFIVMLLTFWGYMTLFGAIASDIGTMLLVTMNGMKLLPKTNRTCCQRRHEDPPLSHEYSEVLPEVV